MDKNRLNLPGFVNDAPFPHAFAAGRWNLADGTLQQLAQSLDVDKEAFKDPDEPIRAVPDPWAQARTFGEALLIRSHSMHDTAVDQWRGLLALFALRDLYAVDYTLDPRPVPMNSGNMFERVLSHLTPKIAMGGRVDLWDAPWLIMIRPAGRPNLPLAMANPICLVSPGRNSLNVNLPSVPWARNGIRDPLGLPANAALPVTQIVALEAWLRRLSAELGRFSGPADRAGATDKIRELLQEYADRCHGETGTTGLNTVAHNSIHEELPDLYRPLWNGVSLEPVADPAARSQTRIRLSPELKGKLGEMKGIILVDKGIILFDNGQPDRNEHAARRTFVWGTRTLAELLGSENIYKSVREDAARHGWLLATADDLFTARAVRLANDPLIASHPPSMSDMLLPLRPLCLLFDGSLKDLVSAKATATRVSVTLRLNFDDGSEAGRPHDLTRHFTTDAAPGQPLLVDGADWLLYNASLWPDFRSPAWRRYYARFTYGTARKGHMARPELALSAALLAHEITAVEHPASAAVARLEDLNRGQFPTIKPDLYLRSERPSGAEYEDIQFSTEPFEAFFYREGLGDRLEAPAGMVFLDMPRKEARPAETVVAVDFGTTNTVACFQSSKNPVVFKRRLVLPVTYKNADTTRNSAHGARWLFSKFLPPEERTTPTPTVALTRTLFPSEEACSVFRNIIYFHSTLRYARNEEADELARFSRTAADAKFNLKWNEDPAHAEAAGDFLEQFLTMIAVEAAANGADPRYMLWRFSIPDSLNSRRRDSFEGRLKTITRQISSEVQETNERKVLAPLYSEGLAAARYIISDAGFNYQSLNMVLDIGGGTTDATIWERDKLVWKGSFVIAGQNFFTRAISQNPEILKPIGLEHWLALFDARAAQEGEGLRQNIPYLAEMLFSGQELQQAIDTHWDTKLNIGTGENLRITALVFLSGLAWYLGRVVRQLIADGLLDLDIVQKPAFALCGRGAGIFRKIHGGRAADDESDVTRALQVFARSAGLSTKPLPQLFTTKDPKDAKLEVVRGMLSNRAGIDTSVKTGLREAKDYMPSGLAVTFSSGASGMAPDSLISPLQFEDKVRAADLAELQAFLDELEACSYININLYPQRQQAAYGRIQNAVVANFDLARSPDKQHFLFEPPYITALRALIDELASPTKTREEILAMRFTA